MPEPDVEAPDLITDHEFDGYTYGDQVFCIHVQVNRVCGRPEHEHASAADEGDHERTVDA